VVDEEQDAAHRLVCSWWMRTDSEC
jgi:hypothetical protein